MNIGDTVKRVRGSHLGMEVGNTAEVTGRSGCAVQLDKYLGWHGLDNLVIVGTKKEEKYTIEETHKPGAVGRAYKVRAEEQDPLGKDAHQPGAKLDAGKSRPALVLGGFARALSEVSKVGTYGATKYTDNGWMEVPNGVARYSDALLRHQLAEQAGQELDPDTKLLHAAHAAWNALARLDLILREKENNE